MPLVNQVATQVLNLREAMAAWIEQIQDAVAIELVQRPIEFGSADPVVVE